MPRKPKDIGPLLDKLSNSFTEEDILSCLIELVKGYEPYKYREIIYNNPYYKSLIPDIQIDIINNLEDVKKSIVKEIDQIESELKKIGNKDSSEQLKNLKKDCLSLIYEIDERKKEIEMLSKY